MRTMIKATLAAAALATASLGAIQPAQARDDTGVAVAAGIIGLGVGAAIASSDHGYSRVGYYGGGGGYYGGPGYYRGYAPAYYPAYGYGRPAYGYDRGYRGDWRGGRGWDRGYRGHDRGWDRGRGDWDRGHGGHGRR
ncbi:hypothetical protein HL653_03110 [Sphingomonas sp. AP4-R1]|uniref:hypothetical protein n=1 Tax=Sphingomonas sp. AP4-R1 TaxID=2735134 RepID=UPI0014937811|nr:hypothetical protein [Sphingomonas sp. AP4-R1]QJU56916.1 hypothetical protein HL653_03110 [Sphingomonas sp. AP4-R1]